MAELKTFSLKGKQLKLTSEADIAPHIKALEGDEDVEHVIFEGNTLGIGASKALADVLREKKKLQESCTLIANFADIFTGRLLSEIPAAIDFILQSLLSLPNLHTINLNDNAFGLNTVTPLVSFLSRHAPLRHLYLNNNGLGPAAGVLVADALSALAVKKEEARKEGKEVPNLETVICGRNRLENGSMAAWAKAYAAHNGVQTVRMVQNGIRPDGTSLLVLDGFSHTKTIKVLDLQDNTFEKKGSDALAKVVNTWTDIVELGLGDCYLTSTGGVKLGKALSSGRLQKLEIMKLNGNELKSRGLKAITEAQPRLPALKTLEIIHDNELLKASEDLKTLRAAVKLDEPTEDEDDDEIYVDEEDESDEEDEGEDDTKDEEEESVEIEEKAARELALADQAEETNVAQEKDSKVDELADLLGKAEIK